MRATEEVVRQIKEAAESTALVIKESKIKTHKNKQEHNKYTATSENGQQVSEGVQNFRYLVALIN